MPDELIPQFPCLRARWRKLIFPSSRCPALRRTTFWAPSPYRGELAGLECCVLSGDRDVLQLVSDKTTVYLTKRA